MQLRSFTCIRCDKTFKEGAWNGCADDPSLPHVVEPKTYYSRNAGLIVHFRVKRVFHKPDGSTGEIPDGLASFKNGRLITDDPELQTYLEHKHTDLLTKDQYEEENLTPAMKQARMKTQIHEQQALLAKQQEELARLRAEREEKATVVKDEPVEPLEEEPVPVVGRSRRR